MSQRIPDSGSSADLPKPGDPLRLPDGTTIYPDGQIKMVSVPKHSEAQEIIVATERKLADMPATPDAMSLPAQVLMYKMSGLADAEIAVALRMPVEMVSRMLMSDIVSQLYDMVKQHVIETDSEKVANILRASATSAAIKMARLSQHTSPAIALSAAKDVLDRSGHSAKQIHRHEFDDLRIVMVDKDDDMKTVNVTPRRIE